MTFKNQSIQICFYFYQKFSAIRSITALLNELQIWMHPEWEAVFNSQEAQVSNSSKIQKEHKFKNVSLSALTGLSHEFLPAFLSLSTLFFETRLLQLAFSFIFSVLNKDLIYAIEFSWGHFSAPRCVTQSIYWWDPSKTELCMKIVLSNPNICWDLLHNCSKLTEIFSQQQGFGLKNRHKLIKLN